MKINLVLGQSAGGLLRQAARDFGLPGQVLVVDDDLSVGPLHDDQTRNEWWATVYGPYANAHQPSLYAQWRAIRAGLGTVSELILWSSCSTRDHVFERMAAFMLDGHSGTLSQVSVPTSGKLVGVSFHEPDALAKMAGNKRALSSGEIANWSAYFANDLRQSSGVRLLQQSSVTILPEDTLDEFLLERCPREWTKWYRVVGEAMADCDEQNLISDTFFSWRLRLLVEAGRVESQGDLTAPDGPKGVLVRRVEAS